MRPFSFNFAVLATALLGIGFFSGTAKANDVYISQNGGGNGSSCSSPLVYTYFNTSSNWTSGTPTGVQIGPGTTVHLCGTITNSLAFQGSGNSTASVTLHFEAGAQMSSPAFISQAINTSGESYIVIDGGTPCGPNTACSANLSGTGIIQNTANGTSLANQIGTAAINVGQGSCGQNIEIKNLIMENIYVRTSQSDESAGATTSAGITGYDCGNNMLVHDNTASWSRADIYLGSATSSNWKIYNNVVRHATWGIAAFASGSTTILSNLIVYGNDIDIGSDWDDPSYLFHLDGLFIYGQGSTGYVNGAYVYNNYFHGNWGSNGTSAAQTGQAYINQNLQNFYIFNNIFDISAGGGAANGNLAIGYSDVNFLIVNNTFLGAGGTLSGCCAIGDAGGGDTGITVENNIEAHIDSGVNFSHATQPATVNYNDNYDITGTGENGAWCNPTLGCTTSFSAWQSAGNDTYGVYADPILNASYLPQPGSAAIHLGTNLYSVCSGQPNPGLGALCYDAAGYPRPATGNWDAGAYNDPPSSAPLPPTSFTAVSH